MESAKICTRFRQTSMPTSSDGGYTANVLTAGLFCGLLRRPEQRRIRIIFPDSKIGNGDAALIRETV